MRNILVLVHDDGGQEARIQAALAVTRAVSGHLTCLDVFAIPVMAGDPWSGYVDGTLVQMARSDNTENRNRIEERLAREDVAWTMNSLTGDPTTELRHAAELSDLIVVSSHGDAESMVNENALAKKVIVKGRRPVLAVPPACEEFDPLGSALVAWDGSPAANQALHEATPLLRKAKDVTVLVSNTIDGPFPAEDAASYLSRHDITANVVERNTSGRIADVIMEQARNTGASYLVMGAFGHSRATQAVFGGVTRSLLEESPVPLLLAH